MRSASESVGSASLHTRYVLDTHVVVVLALGVSWYMDASRGARQEILLLKKLKSKGWWRGVDEAFSVVVFGPRLA